MKMLGKAATHHWRCKCCVSKSEARLLKRATKRRERQAWRREI